MHEKSSEYYGALSSKFTYFSMIFSFLLSTFTLSANNIEIIDYKGFVKLVADNEKTQNWL